MTRTRVINAGNLGAAYTVTFSADDSDILLIGTLNANCTVTVKGMTAGCSLTLQVTQDGTGSRTLSFSPTAKKPGGTALALSTAAATTDVVSAYSPNGKDIVAMVAAKAIA